jgi:Xaa-Pro aminopeptidase
MYSRRLEEVRQKIRESQLQGFLVTHLSNIRFLTGFTGSHAALFIQENHSILVTDGRYRSQAHEEVRGPKIVVSAGSLLRALSQNLRLGKRERIGFEANSIDFMMFENVKSIFDRARLVPLSLVVEDVRVTKDSVELANIRDAIAITDRVFKEILTILKPGIRELEVSGEISYLHKCYGAESDGFDPIVASGIRGSLPHGRASEKKIASGEMVTLDFGCRFRGYHSDLTRTVAVGKPSAAMKKIYRIVLEAQQETIDFAQAGIRSASLDRVARRCIELAGFGKQFNHSLGHGIGLEVHELPRISKRSQERLRENCVITIEPGIYVPKVGGVRIEDDILITRHGREVLSKAPKQLIIL